MEKELPIIAYESHAYALQVRTRMAYWHTPSARKIHFLKIGRTYEVGLQSLDYPIRMNQLDSGLQIPGFHLNPGYRTSERIGVQE